MRARLPSARRSSCASTRDDGDGERPVDVRDERLEDAGRVEHRASRPPPSPNEDDARIVRVRRARRNGCPPARRPRSPVSPAIPAISTVATGSVDAPCQTDRHDGQDRLALPPARVRVPVVGDLRRARLVVRLRPLRRPAQGERQGAVARGDGAGARRHRRARLRDHPPPAGLGGVRSRRRVHRPARRLPHVQAALPRRPPRGREHQELRAASGRASGRARPPTATSPRRASSTSCSRRGSARWRRPARRCTSAPRRRRASSSTSRTSPSSRGASRRSGSPRSARRSATRSRPGNFIFRTLEFEQMEMEYFVPPAEADEWYRYWIDERLGWYTRYGIRAENLRVRAHDADELRTTRARRATSSTCTRSAGRSSRASRTAATSTSRAHTEASGTKLEWVDGAAASGTSRT